MGDHAPGDVLPGELDLAAQHGVSRSVIREAMRMLASKRLIVSRQKAGTRVRPRGDWNLLDPDLLEWMFDGMPAVSFVRNLFELRMIVEPAAAELAAVKRSARQLSEMGHALETMAQHGLGGEVGQAADQKFHSVLLDATGNELLMNLSSTISAAVRWTTLFKYRESKQPRDPIPQHRVLYEAIADGDPAAARSAAIKLIAEAEQDTAALVR